MQNQYLSYSTEVTVSSNTNPSEQDDYPTIEADLNALEVPMQKSLSGDVGVSGTPRQFGCSSYCYNQGTCVLVGQRITCRCPAGFVGVRCQVARMMLNYQKRFIFNIILLNRICT